MVDKNIAELFGSSSNVRILKLFLNNPEDSFNVSDVANRTKVDKKKCRSQVNKLIKIGLIKAVVNVQKKDRK